MYPTWLAPIPHPEPKGRDVPLLTMGDSKESRADQEYLEAEAMRKVLARRAKQNAARAAQKAKRMAGDDAALRKFEQSKKAKEARAKARKAERQTYWRGK